VQQFGQGGSAQSKWFSDHLPQEEKIEEKRKERRRNEGAEGRHEKWLTQV